MKISDFSNVGMHFWLYIIIYIYCISFWQPGEHHVEIITDALGFGCGISFQTVNNDDCNFWVIGIEGGEPPPSKVHNFVGKAQVSFQKHPNILQPKGPSHALVATVDASGHSNRSANTWWCPPKCLEKTPSATAKKQLRDGEIPNPDALTAVVRQNKTSKIRQVEVPCLWNSH